MVMKSAPLTISNNADFLSDIKHAVNTAEMKCYALAKEGYILPKKAKPSSVK